MERRRVTGMTNSTNLYQQFTISCQFCFEYCTNNGQLVSILYKLYYDIIVYDNRIIQNCKLPIVYC